MKKLLSVLLVALFLCTALFPSTGALTVAEESGSDAVPLNDNVLTDTNDPYNFPQYPNGGAVRIDKNVINTEIYNATGVAQIELTAAGIPTTAPVDVVLIIDISASMAQTPSGENTDIESARKMYMARQAAKQFLSVLTNSGATTNENRIAIIKFYDRAEIVQNLTSVNTSATYNSIVTKIDGMTYYPGGGTNYDDPLRLAGDILQKARDGYSTAPHKPVVVFMTDGAPGIYNRACPFYFEAYGDFDGTANDSYEHLRGEVALDVSDYFWDTMSPLDTKYHHSLSSYTYQGGSNTSVNYCVGSNDFTDADNETGGTAFCNFVNTYWYDYVMGNLDAADWTMKQSVYTKTTSLAASSKYLLGITHNSQNYVLSITGDDAYSSNTLPVAYPYFAAVDVTPISSGSTQNYITLNKGIFFDSTHYTSSNKGTGGLHSRLLHRFVLTAAKSTATGLTSHWTLKNNFLGSSGYLRTFNGTPGFGTNATPAAITWRYSNQELNNYNGTSVAYYLRPNNDAAPWYLFNQSNATSADFYFYKQSSVSLEDPIPEELETYGNLRSLGGTGDNIFGARIKGTVSNAQLTAWDIDYSYSEREPAIALNAALYTVGFALGSGSRIDNPGGAGDISFDGPQCANVLRNMASDSTKALNAEDSTELNTAFTNIATDLTVASASNAVMTDQMGAQFDLQLDSFVHTENGTQAIGFEPTIEVGYYTLFESGDRRGERDRYVPMEVLTMANYDAATHSLQGDCVSYDFATETFTLNFELLAAQEISLRYWVHLEGSSEGEREAGIYDTNEYAYLDYTNHLGNDCRQTYPVPELPWGSALTSYEYYLVNEQGQPINEQGQVVAFSERVIVGTTTDISFLLNSLQQVSGNGTVPEGYDMYNSSANYTVQANSDGTGEVFIYDSTGTTYVVAPNVDNTTDTKLDNLSGYTATTFSFAVVLETAPSIELLPLGAQAHMIHQYEDLSLADNPALYTDGIRFGYTIDYGSMQKVLNEGDYFQTGMLLMPMSRINTAKDYATASSLDRAYMNSDYVNVAMMKLNVKTDGSFTAENGQPVFVAKLNGNQFPYATLNSGSMVQWTSAMDNAQSAEELAELLRAAGVVVFGTYRDQIRLMTYILFGGDANDDGRIHKAQRELVSRGYVVTLQNGEYTVYYAHQIANSAKRIWEHYNWDRYRVTERTGLLDRTEEEISRILLQGASRFAPTNQNTNQD